ncbi:MAG: VCBS repeat-containing protein, partial [Nitrospinota bacterium]
MRRWVPRIALAWLAGWFLAGSSLGPGTRQAHAAALPAADALPAKGPVATGYFRGLSVADLDRDGSPELISSDLATGQIFIWPTRKEGGWAQPLVIATGAEVRAIEVADLDGDALPELIVALRGNE